jgi:hypothetical protein
MAFTIFAVTPKTYLRQQGETSPRAQKMNYGTDLQAGRVLPGGGSF